MNRALWVVVLLAGLCSSQCTAQYARTHDAQALIEHGQKALAEKQYAAAEQDFTRLLQLGVRTAPVYSNLGVAYLRLGKFDKAIQMLQQAQKLAPNVAGIRLNLGLAYFRERESNWHPLPLGKRFR